LPFSIIMENSVQIQIESFGLYIIGWRVLLGNEGLISLDPISESGV
jgi:hypothetical protein